MEYFDQEHKLIATFNVKVERNEFHATSDFLIYFLNEEKAIFTGEPKFFPILRMLKLWNFICF